MLRHVFVLSFLILQSGCVKQNVSLETATLMVVHGWNLWLSHMDISKFNFEVILEVATIIIIIHYLQTEMKYLLFSHLAFSVI